jgi:hypothetical protein
MTDLWTQFAAEARAAYRGEGRFPLRAYSEMMPGPYVGVKPYLPERHACTFGGAGDALDIDEYEQSHDLEPGLARIAEHVIAELGRLVRGEAHALSRSILTNNPAWPDELADAARAKRLVDDPLVIALSLALSRTQDDKGNDRWTLFGTSHDGAAAAVWHAMTAERVSAFAAWAGFKRVRIVGDVPPALRELDLGDAPPTGLDAIVTFTPFARLPAAVRAAYLARRLAILPTPASLVFFEHEGYQALARQLPRATQIPLLHLFPRIEGSCAIRIPQSGWLDETNEEHGHHVVSHVARTHRWQRVERDFGIGPGAYTDKVSVALFSTDPDVIGLYDKPLARNAEIWSRDYELLLDGPHADSDELRLAAKVVDAGGRFGYRFAYPAMRAGARELFWHLPLIAKPGGERFRMPGYITAEQPGPEAGLLDSMTRGRDDRVTMTPRLLARPAHIAAATLFERDPGRPRHTTGHNLRKLLDAHDQLGSLTRDMARALVHIQKGESLEVWLDALPKHASDPAAAARLLDELRGKLAPADEVTAPLVLDRLGTRAFEDAVWRQIADLAEGKFRQKSNADGIIVNKGKHGGPAAKKAHVHVSERRDLDALGDYLHARYRELIAKHGMTGRAEVVDHRFRWETDFAFPWMDGWTANQSGAPRERNIVCVIPGRNRGEAVIMGDHYDTAYMEDVYDKEAGGDMLRAPAQGADDNHSATTALLLAADSLLMLARDGKLARDVWLVHLTGEEFPADCMGARAICQQLVEGRLAFTAEDGSARDVSSVRVAGVYVLDMIGHNSDRDRDVFQIAPGEGADSMRLARIAHLANLKWNRAAGAWNRAADRTHAGRAKRMPDGKDAPPAFSHLPLSGEVRVEWEPRSALYNTDGQIFSDIGVPVVLFMENYDISRTGYHDTHDTMANIDLDYCAALTAIAIETVADAACADSL